LREVLTYLGQRGVATMLVGVQQGVTGPAGTNVDVSYLADNVLLLRYYESDGAMHKALSVFKKRGSRHETTLRAFSIGEKGIEVGRVLKGFRGILSGAPVTVSQGKKDAGDE
jgi:circadian clock protein KaiC